MFAHVQPPSPFLSTPGELWYCSLLNKVFYIQLLFTLDEIIFKFNVKNLCLRDMFNLCSLLPEPNLESSTKKYFLLHHIHTYPKYLEKSWRVPTSSWQLIRNGILLSTNQCSHEMGWFFFFGNYLVSYQA